MPCAKLPVDFRERGDRVHFITPTLMTTVQITWKPEYARPHHLQILWGTEGAALDHITSSHCRIVSRKQNIMQIYCVSKKTAPFLFLQ